MEIIKALYIEVIQNIESTINFKEKNQTRLVAIHHLLNITDEDLAIASDEYLHQEIMASAIIDNYTPSISKLNRLLSMEELESDKTKKLVILLYVYSNSIQDIKVENKKTLDIFMEKQIPLFNRNISVKNIMHQRWPEKISASKNVVELKLFVKSLVFENIYADIYATATLTSMYLEKNIQLMQKIIHQIEDNYPVGVIAKSS
ncbi:hypothetical protein [Colwellia hornerae]|uniref:Uncharacterized protein n=1 Tax=Colwellia hornerae TaxID=89402 RepID=A0A5C6QBZ4_9GAMM|nr:hypothetical protein [Colwellia hornerae]TWX55174.1 hypothetical protein ESZ28_06600 [Colwellia hornerae]TWX61174.1 hypothetical protein ESZ26_05375 [Colwellia hornerae]TWX66476.1 hypothetical protein ESZ27_10640 [Colwellia hornerae]